MSKWKSRKLWIAVASLVLVFVTDIAGVNINPDTYWGIVGIVSAYLLGQSIVDARHTE